jgi:hypothetical protein
VILAPPSGAVIIIRVFLFKGVDIVGDLVEVVVKACNMEQGVALVHDRYLRPADDDAGVG